MPEPVIVVAAYSRTRGLRRLLESINRAVYPSGQNIQLIISIDGGGSHEVENIADEFDFVHGDKSVTKRENNIGLREHILWCGDLSEKYGSVIVLEDDLLVDRFFYIYAKNCLEFYQDAPKIAGVALYSPRRNEFVDLPFVPLRDQHSGYFMQTACSWGQAWTTRQWSLFRNWMSTASPEGIYACESLPAAVRRWPESSWKKYFCAYLVNCDQYFFYPFDSYSTNFSDRGGEHLKSGTSLLQVPFRDQSRLQDCFKFPATTESAIRYDSFMESDCNAARRFMGSMQNEIHFDFYGSKSRNLLLTKRYVVTTRKVRKYVRSFELILRPFEVNVQFVQQSRSFLGHSGQQGPIAYVAHSADVVSSDIPRFKLARYFSYFSFFNKDFLKQQFWSIIKKIGARIASKIGW